MDNVLHIYTRVSTTSQEDKGSSLESQKEAGIEDAKKRGMKYKVWNEGGKSSSNDNLDNRPVLNNLLHLVDQGEVKNIYVWNTDRLSRNLNTWGMIRFKLVKNGITLFTPTGKQQLSDFQTNFLLGILSEISQYDNQLRTERFRLGKLSRVRNGGWMGGPPPYGYRIENKRLQPDEYESKWVKFIFESYGNGKTVDEIRTELMNNGVVTRRQKPVWSHGSLDKLLTNTHYSGYYNYTDKKSGETIRVSCPSILSSSLILEVNKVKKSRSYGIRGNKRAKTSTQKYVYLLNYLLVCGHCGSRYGGNYKKTQTSYYSCNQKTNKFKTKFTEKHVICGSNRNIRIDKTDKIVWETVVKVIKESHIFKESVKIDLLGRKSYNLSKEKLKKLKRKGKNINDEIKKTTESIVRLETDNLIGRRNSEELKKIILGLEEYRLEKESELEHVNTEITMDNDHIKWMDWLKEFGSRIERLNDSDMKLIDKKKFIEGIVKDIVVTNIDVQKHELIIKFRLAYVEDGLTYVDNTNKSKGYTIDDGTDEKVITVNLLKKNHD